MKTLIKSIIIIFSGILLSCYDTNNYQTTLEPSQIDSNVNEMSFSYKDFTYENYSSSIRENTYRNNFIGILNKLNLDSLQRVKINKLLLKHRECVNSCVSEFKKKEKEILDSARIEFREIRFNASNGIITKEQARELLKALNERVKNSIKSLNQSCNTNECRNECRNGCDKECQSKCNKSCVSICDKEFIDSLLPILTKEQANKFNEMIKQRRHRLGETKKDSIEIKRDTTNKKRKIG